MNVSVLSPQSTLHVGSEAAVVITVLKPGHLLFSIFGYNNGEIGAPIYAAMDAAIAHEGFVACYMDTREQSGISAEERQRAALWAKAKGKQFRAAHMLFRSRLLQLALAAGNLVALTRVKAYASVDVFQSVIQLEVPGFTHLPDFKSVATSALNAAQASPRA